MTESKSEPERDERIVERAKEDAVLTGGRTVALIALVKLLVHLLTTGRFGYEFFVDELYFLACSEHLDWGFVDLPPLFPAVTAAIRATLGDSLFAMRLLPTLAGAALVVLAARIAREMGGGRLAQGIAALSVLLAPIYLVMHSIHTMNALEPLFWMGCVLLLVKMINGGDERLWLLFGAIAGLGLLNKHSMAFFGFGVVVALLLSPERSILRRRWIWLGGLVAFLMFLPNLVWDIRHGFPHLEQLANIRANGRDVSLSSLQFIGQQIQMLHPVALLVWLGGLVWLLFDREGKRCRTIGILYLAVLALMLVMRPRVYYLAPIYAMLFAAGGVAIERWVAAKRWARMAIPVFLGIFVATGVLLAPTFLPCLHPETFIRFSRALHLEQPRIETHRLGSLPQLFADRFGWKEMAEAVARAYHSMPPEVREKTAIFGQNYGQAGAIDHYGPALGLPKAISGHLTYHYWGPRNFTGESIIVLGDDRETLEGLFEEVRLVGRVEHPYSMPYQHFDVYWCTRPRRDLRALWPEIKRFN